MKQVFCLLMLGLTLQTSFAQTEPERADLSFAVQQMYPYLSLTSEELAAARTLSDLNRRFKPEWIKEYRSVEVRSCSAGNIVRTQGQSEVLTKEQLAALRAADPDREIRVRVRYLPNNTLATNEEKTLEFTLNIDPDFPASFPGESPQAARDYFYQQAIATIPHGTFTGYDFAAVTFTVDATGAITKVALFESSGDPSVDESLLAAVRTMPAWIPARYANGTPVAQDFALTVGNLENCLVTLLGVQKF